MTSRPSRHSLSRRLVASLLLAVFALSEPQPAGKLEEDVADLFFQSSWTS